MKKTIFYLMLLLLVTVSYETVICEESKTSKNIGISASLQSSQFDILVPIWFSDDFALIPALGLVWVEGKGSDVSIGGIVRFMVSRQEIVAPYIGLRLGSLIAKPAGVDAVTDWLLGLAVGGEYFLGEKFSLGVESQFNFTISDSKSIRFGNPGNITFNTGAAVFATIYF